MQNAEFKMQTVPDCDSRGAVVATPVDQLCAIGICILHSELHAFISVWARQDSNLGPTDYEPAALTAELRARVQSGKVEKWKKWKS
jgi:hypothetical protein